VGEHWTVPLRKEVLVRPWHAGLAQKGHVVIAASDLPPRRQGHAFTYSPGSVWSDAATSARTASASCLPADYPQAAWEPPSAATSAGATSAAATFPLTSPAGAPPAFGLVRTPQDGRIIARVPPEEEIPAEEGGPLVLRGDVCRLPEQCTDSRLHALQARRGLPGVRLPLQQEGGEEEWVLHVPPAGRIGSVVFDLVMCGSGNSDGRVGAVVAGECITCSSWCGSIKEQ
tara:strand:- start:29 stop:715 length:687 start_codon:yes stop_codon:yes gene_type:complete